MPDAGAIGDVAGLGLRALEQSDAAAPVGTMLEIPVCERPADRAVAQRHHLVGDAGVDQRLGADDRAGAAGAIDDNGGLRIRRSAARAQHQLGARYADRARDVHGGVFVEAADIEDLNVGAISDQGADFLGGQRRRVAAMLHQLAKGLGIGIDVLEQFITGLFPALQPAIELADIGVAQGFQTIRSLRHEAFTVIVEDDRYVLARQPRFGLQRDPVGRHVGGKQGMAGGKDSLVPDIEQCDFIAQQQRGADLPGCDGGYGHDWNFLLEEVRFSTNSSIASGASRRTEPLTQMSSNI